MLSYFVQVLKNASHYIAIWASITECKNHLYFTYLVQRPKFIAPHKFCLIEGGRSWYPFINLSKSKVAEMIFFMLCWIKSFAGRKSPSYRDSKFLVLWSWPPNAQADCRQTLGKLNLFIVILGLNVTRYVFLQSPVLRYAKQEKLHLYKWPLPDLRGHYDVGVIVSFGHLIPDDVINMFPRYANLQFWWCWWHEFSLLTVKNI